MQVMVAHFFDEMVFFPWVPFIQMHKAINISLDLLIETWIKINNFIMKIIVWLFIDKTIHFVNGNGFLKSKNMDWSFDWNTIK
jgi:hypothetical protein